MKQNNDGGPAFPHGPLGDTMHGEDGREWHQYPAGTGMSLRDWFAGRALSSVDERSRGTPQDVAKECYQLADAMLAERERKTE